MKFSLFLLVICVMLSPATNAQNQNLIKYKGLWSENINNSSIEIKINNYINFAFPIEVHTEEGYSMFVFEPCKKDSVSKTEYSTYKLRDTSVLGIRDYDNHSEYDKAIKYKDNLIYLSQENKTAEVFTFHSDCVEGNPKMELVFYNHKMALLIYHYPNSTKTISLFKQSIK